MNFGNDEHPKWSEKEEMTLIFLCALCSMTSKEVSTELNAMFGNCRTALAVDLRMKKDERAIEALRDLIRSNPSTVGKFLHFETGIPFPVDEEALISFDGKQMIERIPDPGKVAAPKPAPRTVPERPKDSSEWPLLVTSITKDGVNFDKDAGVLVEHVIKIVEAFKR